MKKVMIGALLAGQLLAAAQPALAADLVEQETPRMGAFAGARLRIPLGGMPGTQRLRAGFTLAPTMRTQNAEGASRLGIGEGLELGIAGREPLRLSLAGQRLDRIGARRANVSTLGWVAIGVGTLVVVTAGVGYLWLEDALDCDPGDDCS